jgi:hypothetical protein
MINLGPFRKVLSLGIGSFGIFCGPCNADLIDPPEGSSLCIKVCIICLSHILCTIAFCFYFFQHISWLWYPCPNRHSSGDGTLIADGTAVFNASLYGIRIIGENGVFISELQILQNPLQTGIAGLYRCEAWLHGANKDSTKHQTSSAYHDEFIIGGNLMVESCFYDPHRHKYYYEHYEPTTHSHKLQKSYRTPRNKAVSDGTTHKIYGDSKVNKT